MLEYTVIINGSHLASNYGSGNYNASTYNGETSTGTNPGTNPGATPGEDTGTGTTAPGTPNTGFFQSAFSGAEASLIPIILVVAVAAGAATVGVRKMLRKNK